MRMFVLFLSSLLSLLLPPAFRAHAAPSPDTPAHAPQRGAPRAHEASHADPVDVVLLTSGTPDTLRARLLALATGNPNRRVASQALYYRGLSFERAARPDSAVENYRRALSLGRNPMALSALVDALLRRRADGDVAQVIELLEKVGEADEAREAMQPDPARLGWAYLLSGDDKRGLELLLPLETRLVEDPVWRYRFARAYLRAGNSTRAAQYLVTLAAAARNQDRDVASMLRELNQRLGANARIPERTTTALQDHDDREIALLTLLGGRRVRVKASDGAYIGGVLFADSLARRVSRAAVILAGLGDEVSDYDSLTVALRKTGFSVFVLDPRGSGWSVAPEYSLPDTWEGRQDALGDRVTRDVRDALNAFGRVARIDTSRVLLIGVGPMAPLALAAAAADRRVSALALLDPWTSPVDRGVTLATASRVQIPTFIHVGVLGRGESAFADTLLHTLPRKTSRLVESTALSGGASAFGSRPDVTPRFVRWVDETFKAKPPRRVIPRSQPRAG